MTGWSIQSRPVCPKSEDDVLYQLKIRSKMVGLRTKEVSETIGPPNQGVKA